MHTVVTALALALAGCAPAEGEQASESGSSYVVGHAMGETRVDGPPERVVVIDSPHLDALLALGITPVGATESGAGEGFPGYLSDELTGTESVGQTMEPDIEKIAGLDPDLIIGAKVRHEDLYEQLSGIAPTVFSEGSGTNWQEQATITAEAVDRAEDMDVLLDELEARAQAVGQEVGAGDLSLSIVRFRPDNFRLYGPETFSGSVLTQAGFDLGDREWDEFSMMELSAENYPDIDGDVIFYTNPGGDPGATTMSAVTQLWDELPAVREGNVFDVEDETWMVGIGVIGAGIILDDVERALG